MRCPESHDTAYCPHINFSPRSDALDQLRERFIRKSAFAGQLLRELRAAGITPSAATLALDPDAEDVV